jgi:ArsR family transcriptional regulator
LANSTVQNKEKRRVCKSVLNLPMEVEAELRRVGGLGHIVENLPEICDLEANANLYHAPADANRLRILNSLWQCNLCPCILKEVTTLSDSKLSYHLNTLEEAKLIKSFPRRRWRTYVLTELGKSSMRRE